MKRKAFIVSVLIAVLYFGIISSASAHRWGYGRGYGYYRPHPVWVVPPPRVVIAPPPYGYYRPHYYGRARYYGAPRYYGYNRPYHRRW